MNVQNVLDQFYLKLIQICYIQIRYIQFRIKIGWFRVNQTCGRSSSNRGAPDRQTTRIFFPVVIVIPHPPDRWLELFFSARNSDRVLQVHISMYNQNLFPARTKNWHNSTTGKKVPPAHAKRGQVPPAHAKRVFHDFLLA